jgi:hypothetical protein
MRYAFMLVVPALVAGAAAQAENYLTVEQAQQQIFPGATFTAADFTLSEAEVDELLRVSQATVFRSRVRAWKVSTGGWFILDQVMGRDDRVTYAIGLRDDGSVAGIEVLVCLPGYDGVRGLQWRNQFRGKKHDASNVIYDEISNISGTTLSVDHITEGVKRVLATYALFIAPRQG